MQHAKPDRDRHRDRRRHAPHRLQSIAELRSRLSRVRHHRRRASRRRAERSLRAAGDVGRRARSHAGALAAAAELDIDNIRAISGSAQQHGSVYLNRTRRRVLARRSIRAAPLAPQLPTIFSRRDVAGVDGCDTTAQCREIETALGGADATRSAHRFAGMRAIHRPADPQVLPAAARRATRRPRACIWSARIWRRCSPARRADRSRRRLRHEPDGPRARALVAGSARRDRARSRPRLPPIRPSWEIVGRLSPYWQKRYALPAAAIVTWTGDNPSSLVGTGIIRRRRRRRVARHERHGVRAARTNPPAQSSHVFRIADRRLHEPGVLSQRLAGARVGAARASVSTGTAFARAARTAAGQRRLR